MFYTYLWLREDGTPYYVGKGSGKRAFVVHPLRGKIYKAPPAERIVIYYAKSEQDAFETEVALIWYYGRKDLGTGILRNLTDGGENPPTATGRILSEKHRSILIESNKSRVWSIEARRRLSEVNKTRKHDTGPMIAASRVRAAVRKAQTHCKRGHDLSLAHVNTRGSRQCRVCVRINYKRRKNVRLAEA